MHNENYTDILRNSGLKATVQRIGVLDILHEMGHSSIDEIYEKVQQRHPSISLATVYKNVDTMLEKGVILEIPIAGAKSKYEIKKEEHIHLICQRCGSVTDESMEKLDCHRLDEITAKSRFSLSYSQVNLYGICEACQKAS
jgi:Fe2+ or Zn2+ uptake regulation protein